MKRLLIIEDVELNTDLLVQILEEDYALLTASDGAEGLRLAGDARPDAILLDLSLPLIDGWEVARRLKSDPELRHIPVIALSAHAMQGDEDRALEAGCDVYLAKPIDEDLLLETLRHRLGVA